MRDTTSLPDRTEVAIVGAGPSGLTLACVLAETRVPFVLLDRLAEGANTSRAAVVHSRTLEVLEPLGVSERLLQGGVIVPRFTVRDRDRVLAAIDFDRLPTRYPHTLMIPQQCTEAILVDRLHALGGAVHRPWTVEGLRQDDSHAKLTVAGADGTRRTVQARWVVGADGMHSTVRQQAGIGFAGAAYDSSFVLADVRMEWPLRRDEVMLFFSPRGLVVVAPLPGGRHRVVATIDEAPEHPDVHDVQRLLDARGPGGSVRVHDVVWSTRFRVHHRLAERYRSGRVVLVGDAAHVHSPAGGQGMNTGIQDAIALGGALVKLVRGHEGVGVLDAYEGRRRPVAERVVAFTDRMTRVATMRNPGRRWIRNGVLSLVGRNRGVRNRIAVELSGLRNQ